MAEVDPFSIANAVLELKQSIAEIARDVKNIQSAQGEFKISQLERELAITKTIEAVKIEMQAVKGTASTSDRFLWLIIGGGVTAIVTGLVAYLIKH